ncbi:TRAP transporter small permease [Actibacterium sp. MT2.3-13A]|uniref:TRAP transporter small permease subunit n=1 Tax=Actibacterium sp. MT2.3-13A TaxID=2828332 RepID=UPI001BA8843D|nr:TRAP transporter small permease [Actibacterium sp. MT2.3-13A]
MLATTQRFIERLAFLTVLLGGLGLLISMFLGMGDVVGSLFDNPLPGALEVTESTMVLIVFGGLAYAQIRQRHLRVELAYLKAGPKMRSVMDIIASLSGVTFFCLMVWQGFNEALFSYTISEATSGLVRFPLYPARFALVLGASLLVVQLVFDLVRDIVNFGVDKDFELG